MAEDTRLSKETNDRMVRLVRIVGTYLAAQNLVYPFLVIGSFYATGAMAWIRLGHWPRTPVDDPSGMLAYIIVSALTYILIAIGPYAILFSHCIVIAWIIVEKTFRRWWVIAMEAGSVVTLIVGIAFTRWDPHGIVAWVID